MSEGYLDADDNGTLTVVDGELRQVSESLLDGFARLHAQIGQMTDLQLFTVYHKAAQLGRQSWMIQAHVLHEVKERKAHHNDGAVRATAAEFGISPSNASGLIRAWEAFGLELADKVSPDEHLVGVSWYKTMAYTEEPLLWLERAREAKRSNPAYSIRDLREDIERATPRRPATPVAPYAPTLAPPPPTALLRDADTSLDRTSTLAVAPARATPPPAAGRTDDVTVRFLALVELLDELTEGTDVLVHRTDPATLAGQLPLLDGDGLFEQEQLAVLCRWLLEVFAERTALATQATDGRRRRKLPPRTAVAG